MEKALIFSIEEFSIHDGPGLRTTVFLKGCPLRCEWCHNPEGLSPKPEIMVTIAQCIKCGACKRACPSPDNCIVCGKCVSVCPGGFRKITGKSFSSEALANRLKKDKDVYDSTGGGVTFSGGEPLLQWAFVREVIRQLNGVHTAIETSGYTEDKVFLDAIRTVSLVIIDWKLSDDMLHKQFTGVSNEPIYRHIQMLAEGDTPFILRMPIIPGVNDNIEHFQTAARLVRDSESLERVEILPYRREAGAKYEMVGRTYSPGFDENNQVHMNREVFEQAGIPYRVFK